MRCADSAMHRNRGLDRWTSEGTNETENIKLCFFDIAFLLGNKKWWWQAHRVNEIIFRSKTVIMCQTDLFLLKVEINKWEIPIISYSLPGWAWPGLTCLLVFFHRGRWNHGIGHRHDFVSLCTRRPNYTWWCDHTDRAVALYIVIHIHTYA